MAAARTTSAPSWATTTAGSFWPNADGERRFRPSGNAAHYLGLYDTERIELREGDLIRWTRNRKAPPARGRHPQAPDLVNGGEAEILEIGYRRGGRFREGGREFSLALTDPQLRHLDHAYCSTVHSAQGRTARAAIAVLDAGAGADRELFHVELSRVSEEFLLLTDDRDALIESMAYDRSEDGALESLGIDFSEPPRGGPRGVRGVGGGLGGRFCGRARRRTPFRSSSRATGT